MRNLIIIVAVLALLYLFAKWFTRTPSKQVSSAIRKYALYGIAALLIFFVVTGRMHWLYGVIAGLIPVAQRLFTAWRTVNYFRRFTTPKQQTGGNSSSANSSTSQSSSIETDYLNVSLSHETGEMTGIVTRGLFKGQYLKELTISHLISLLSECRNAGDNESVSVLEAYLDRYHNSEHENGWREHYRHYSTNNNPASADSNTMSESEAYQVLGLLKPASEKEIKDAHRRLIQRFHPDRGGSTYLSVKINQAKDYLLSNIT